MSEEDESAARKTPELEFLGGDQRIGDVGLIGYGRMGRLLAEGFLASGTLLPEQLAIGCRAPSDAESLQRRYAGIHVTCDAREIARSCSRIFVCVRPLDVAPLLEQVRCDLPPNAHIVSIAAGVAIAELERATGARVTRLIPSVTLRARAGIALVCHGAYVQPGDVEFVKTVLAPLCEVITIGEEDLGVAINLTSSAPAFIAAACEEVAHAAIASSTLTPGAVERMVVTTLYGVAKLLYEHKAAYPDVIAEVATRGGITEEGIHIIRGQVPGMVARILEVTADKTALFGRQVVPQYQGV